MKNAYWMLWLVAAFAVTRCFYDPDLSKITDDGNDGDTATSDTVTSDTATPDAGSSDTGESGGSVSGIGTSCNGQGDACAGYDADYCLMDPTNPDAPGMCTVRGCDTKGCPDTYLCCDCSGLGMEIMCVPEASAGTISAFCPCS